MPRQVVVPALLSRRGFCLTGAAAALASCASPPVGDSKAAPLFYPAAPAAPRIQYLATFSSERDFAASEGAFARFVLGEERNPRRLARPYGVAMFDGKLYVADSRAPGLAVFDFVKKRMEVLPGSGGGRLARPINVTIDGAGTKYVTDTGRKQVVVFDAADRFVAAFGSEGQFTPVDTVVVDDRIYVVDVEHHQVHVLHRPTGGTLFTFGTPGSNLGELFQPTNVAVGPQGDVYVVETGNFRVQRFTADGTPVRSYGQVGTGPGSFARPKGIAIDRAGRMYVGDAAFQNVQIFDKDGRLLLHFGEAGEGFDGLVLPAGVALDYEHAALFRSYADPEFVLGHVVFVASQYGPNKVDVFGFGRKRAGAYTDPEE